MSFTSKQIKQYYQLKEKLEYIKQLQESRRINIKRGNKRKWKN